MYLLLCLISAFFGLISCNPLWDSHRIVGGSPIDISQAPYQVSIQVYTKEQYRHMCGGSILNEYNVLTAAHCSSLMEPYSVLAGTSNCNRGGDRYSVTAKHDHPNYGDLDNDIAIYKVDRKIKFTNNVKPVKLAERGMDVDDGTMLLVTGWGRIRESGPPSETLLQVTVPKINQQVCAKWYLKPPSDLPLPKVIITPRMLCAGLKDQSACKGDSGGPLMMNGVQVGIVNFSYGCARENYPAGYAKISEHRDWIDRTIGS